MSLYNKQIIIYLFLVVLFMYYLLMIGQLILGTQPGTVMTLKSSYLIESFTGNDVLTISYLYVII